MGSQAQHSALRQAHQAQGHQVVNGTDQAEEHRGGKGPHQQGLLGSQRVDQLGADQTEQETRDRRDHRDIGHLHFGVPILRHIFRNKQGEHSGNTYAQEDDDCASNRRSQRKDTSFTSHASHSLSRIYLVGGILFRTQKRRSSPEIPNQQPGKSRFGIPSKESNWKG